jgi:hypothetical protein
MLSHSQTRLPFWEACASCEILCYLYPVSSPRAVPQEGRGGTGINYRGLAVPKGDSVPYYVTYFLSFSVVSDATRWWFIAWTVLAASGHLTCDAVCFVSYSIVCFVSYSNCRCTPTVTPENHFFCRGPNPLSRALLTYKYTCDSGGICTTLGDDSMSDSKQKSSYEHGSDF